MSDAPRAMTAEEAEAFIARLAETDPAPTTELNYSTPFELLVAVSLSAQSTDVGVNKATEKLFRVANTPQAMLELGEEGIRDYIRNLGLYNNKAKNLAEAARILVAEHGGEVPEDRAALERLPGVGRKTANVILNTAFGHPTIAVDTHIFRVSNRTGLAPGKNVTAVERALEAILPAAYKRHAHHWLILHGRYTCTARRPKCAQCRVFDLCLWPEKAEYAESAAS
ncbi:DNA-(apurinic or apyrimidinic site) lyase /endonuclease III [Thiohalorhabdus denitrificans]|uniref:Endonuclease III n=2 Tax=Thiohalorhabdus denitrificans TaxID=381306 RepID=A0A1G5FPT3_9GAMM|nr:DNA-(apurinic or apyrimidinic site) lyase /endonuclease III [Thiohalorhabdus denitrificans]